MKLLYVLLLFAAFLCFFVSAVTRGRYDSRVTLVPLGLALAVAVPLLQAIEASE